MKLLGEHFDLANGTCVANLPAGYCVPEVRVTTTEPDTARKPAGPARGADLQKLITNTHQFAEAGRGVIPPEVQPIQVNVRARKRFSFSRLSGQLALTTSDDAGETEYGAPFTKLPSRRTADVVDARGLGTLTHAVLERINFARPVADLADLCEFLAPQHVKDSWPTAAAEATDLIGRFLSSSRAAQLADAREVHREIEFLLPWPLDRQPYEGRYLHGYIDCLYQDAAGDWHLLDYKSNPSNRGSCHAVSGALRHADVCLQSGLRTSTRRQAC